MKRQKIKQFFQRKEIIFRPVNAIGSLRSDDDDEGDGNGNEKGKTATGLYWQNNNFARASRFFVYFSAVVSRLQRHRQND